MGHLLGAIDQKLLDEQRGVVQNEKREGENQPYGVLREPLTKARYPKGHPYSWSTIGSMNDLNAASLDDVKNWFRAAYGPNNAVLVLAGDIDLATAKEKVTRYFGDIPAGPDFKQPVVDVAPMKADSHLVLTDKVPQVSWSRIWNVAQTGSEAEDALDLFSQVLGGSSSSRLDKRLVFKEKLVDSISTSYYGSQLSGTFAISAAIKQGVDPKKVEAIIDEELQLLLKGGPTSQELEQAKISSKAGFIRQIERIGGFGGKADVLASCVIYTNDPDCFKKSLAALEKATPKSVTAAANKWLNNGSLYAIVEPVDRKPVVEEASMARTAMPAVAAANPKYKTIPSTVDRSLGVPKTENFPALKFPALQRATLKNDLQVVLAERPGLPVVQFSMNFQGAGFASDQANKAGIASFTMGMLDEGAGQYDALALRDRTELLGANISTSASMDGSTVYLSSLKENLAESLALFSEVISAPRFDDAEIERVRGQWLTAILQEKARPANLARRLANPLIYGEGHPYAIPSSGTGNESAIKTLTKADMQAWHAKWVRPENADLVIVGDTTLKEIIPKLDAVFASWPGGKSLATKAVIPTANLPAKPRVFLVNQPGAVQSNILVSQLVPSSKDAEALKFEIANSVLGGEFSSRLNMNLREDKHWAYGSYSGVGNALGQRLWLATAAVQTDKTSESLQELLREISEYSSAKAPAKADELAKIQATEVRALPGSFETANAILTAINSNIRYDYPDDYQAQRASQISAMTLAEVNQQAKTINPDSLTWIIVGDLSKIEKGIRALNIGPVTVLDNDGNVIK